MKACTASSQADKQLQLSCAEGSLPDAGSSSCVSAAYTPTLLPCPALPPTYDWQLALSSIFPHVQLVAAADGQHVSADVECQRGDGLACRGRASQKADQGAAADLSVAARMAALAGSASAAAAAAAVCCYCGSRHGAAHSASAAHATPCLPPSHGSPKVWRAMFCPVEASHRRTSWSRDPEASREGLRGWKRTTQGVRRCPDSTRTSVPLAQQLSLTVWSPLQGRAGAGRAGPGRASLQERGKKLSSRGG